MFIEVEMPFKEEVIPIIPNLAQFGYEVVNGELWNTHNGTHQMVGLHPLTVDMNGFGIHFLNSIAARSMVYVTFKNGYCYFHGFAK
jgi:hypothetical protein